MEYDIKIKNSTKNSLKIMFGTEEAKRLFVESSSKPVPAGSVTIKKTGAQNLIDWAILHRLTIITE